MTITRDEAEQAAELRGAELERARIVAIIDGALEEGRAWPSTPSRKLALDLLETILGSIKR